MNASIESMKNVNEELKVGHIYVLSGTRLLKQRSFVFSVPLLLRRLESRVERAWPKVLRTLNAHERQSTCS